MDGEIIDANERAVSAYGYSIDELRSLRIENLRSPDFQNRIPEQMRIAYERGLVFEAEHLKKDGTRFSVEVSSRGVVVGGERILLSIIRDISERKEAERRIMHSRRLYAVLSQSNQTIVCVDNREELFERICRVAVDHGGFRLAWIGAVDEVAGSVVAVASHGDDLGYLSVIQIPLDDETFSPGPAVRAIRGGKPVICNDVPGDPMFARWRDAAMERGYLSMGSFPIRTSETVTHVLNVHSDEANFFTGEEIRLLSEIADDIAFALGSLERKEFQRAAEEALRQSEARYRLVSENGSDVIWLYDIAEHRFSYISPSVEKLRGYTVDEVLSQSMREVLTAESYAFMEKKMPERLAAFAAGDESVRTMTHEVDQVRRDGSVVPTEVVTTLIVGEEGRVTHIQGVSRDITERRRAERLLREKDALLREMSEVAHIGGWEFDPATGRGTWTEEVARIHDLDPDMETNTEIGLGFFYGEHRAAIENAVRAAVEEGVPYDLELELVTAKGVRKWVRTIGLVDRKDGRIHRVHGTMQDITQRKLVEECVRASLREKEVLLKEIHHRVKNNMQVIISLLNLQSRSIHDDHLRRVFNDSVTRIHSMALVHEKLYRSDNFARIDFKEYLDGLIDIISRSYLLDRGRVRLSALVPPVEWGVDTAIPCGLIVSEAITNAVKHAFPGDADGEIRVSLAEERAAEDGAVYFILEISDNGVGMPEDARSESAESLGMVLMRQLVHQLNGTLEILRGAGSTVRVRFPGKFAEKQ